MDDACMISSYELGCGDMALNYLTWIKFILYNDMRKGFVLRPFFLLFFFFSIFFHVFYFFFKCECDGSTMTLLF